MDKLKQSFKKYYIFNDISGILFWDNATNLPSKSINSRVEQMSILAEFNDKTLRNSDVIKEISLIEASSLSDIDKKNFHLMKEIIARENAVDPGLKSKLIKKKLECEQLWRTARDESNSSIIEKYSKEKMILSYKNIYNSVLRDKRQ